MKRIILSVLLFATICATTDVEAKRQDKVKGEPTMAELIAASQSGSMAVFFNMKSTKPYDIDLGGFSNPQEYHVRRGLPNFFRKCQAGEEVTVAYIGGSITKADEMYRKQTADYIASMYPECRMNGVNAGIGGTGADLGACRFEEQVQRYNPDLLIIEFAVNGANEKGIEGMVRKMIKHNPECDIMFVYTVYAGQAEEYVKGDVPFNIKRLEGVAEHYNLPSVHMGMWAGYLISQDKMVWKGNPVSSKNEGGKVAFSRDGVHPLTAGGTCYAASVARAMEQMKSRTGVEKLELIEPLSPLQMESATMVHPRDLGIDSSWKVRRCEGDSNYDQFKYWFEELYDGTHKSKPLSFKFRGSMVGVFDIGGIDGAAIDIFIDGKKAIPTKMFNNKVRRSELFDREDPRYSLSRFIKLCVKMYRGQFDSFAVEEGLHEVEIRVCEPSRHDKKSVAGLTDKEYSDNAAMLSRQVFHLGRILIDGEIVK